MNMNLHSQSKKSLTYWELVRKKFLRKPYAVIGTFVVISIVILGIFVNLNNNENDSHSRLGFPLF